MNHQITRFYFNGVTATSADRTLVNINGIRSILAMGLVSEMRLYKAVHEMGAEVYVIGDSAEPRRMGKAIPEGYRAGSVI